MQLVIICRKYYLALRNGISPGNLNAYPSFDTSSTFDEAHIINRAKDAYKKLIDPDTGKIDSSNVEKQLKATRYLLDYLNWVLQHSNDDEKKKRSASLKKRLAEIYNRKKWINRLGELFSWLFGLMQGASIAGYFILMFGVGTATRFNLTGILIMLGAGVFFGIVGLAGYYIIKREMPRLLLAGYNRWYKISAKDPHHNRAYTIIAFCMAFVAALIFTGIDFYGAHKLLVAIHHSKGIELGALTWTLPLALSFSMVFLPALTLSFEGNKDFFKDWEVNRSQGKRGFESFDATQVFWEGLQQKYDLTPEQILQLRHEFKWNAGYILLSTLGSATLGLTALNIVFGGGVVGTIGSGILLIMGTFCQIAFFRARAKDLAIDNAKSMALSAKEMISLDPAEQPHGKQVNTLRATNALLGAIPPAMKLYDLAGINFFADLESWMAFAGFVVMMTMLGFMYVSLKSAWAVTSIGAPTMWEVRSMAEEIEKPVAEEQILQQSQLYTPSWDDKKRFTPNRGCHYETMEDFKSDIKYVKGRMEVATTTTTTVPERRMTT